MINVFKQFTGLRNIKDLWLGMYIFKFAMALLMVIPLYLVNNSVLSSSLYSKPLISSWDMSVIIEMFFGRGEIIPQYIIFVFIGAVIYVGIMQFINGGLFYTFVSGRIEKINWRDFFGECGTGFNTNIKITVLMIIVYVLLLFSGMFFVNIIGMAGGYPMGTAAVTMMLFKLVILLIIMLAASTFSDSARAAAAAYPEKPFREILKVASTYFKPALPRLLKIYIITFIPFIILWLLAEWLALATTGGIGGLIGIFIELCLFQLTSFFRTGQKLWYLICFGKDFRAKNEGRFLPEQTSLEL